MKIRNFLLLLLMLFSQVALAQDIHFSQYFASQLTLNPALTGNFSGAFRVSGIYRNQWFNIRSLQSGSPYETYSAAFDVAVFRKSLETDQLGLGLLLYSDRAGDGNLTTQSATLSAAYHKGLDEYNRYHLTIGVQGGIVQKRIDFSKLFFEEQYDGDLGFNGSLDNNENIQSSSFYYPDFNVGLLGQAAFGDRTNAYAGFALFHVFSPKESFLQVSDNRISQRYVAHAGINIGLGDYVLLLPSALYMTQSTASQLNVGSALGFVITDDATAYAGAWYRLGDAVIPYIGFEFYGARFGLSYDVTVSSLKTAAKNVSSLELSLIYTHKSEPPNRFNPVKFCPRF